MSKVKSESARNLAILLMALGLGACGAPDDAAASGTPDAAVPAEAGGADGSALDGTVEAGGDACLGASDTAALDQVDLEVAIPTCVKPLVTSGKLPTDPDFSSLVSACLTTNLGLSAPCADCQAAFAACSATQCLLDCIADPAAEKCVACRCGESAATDCISARVACTGLADQTCAARAD
ncbi:MAG: hypothetical protein OZ921_05805 [Sorangiineae bacterium]|nr:hypothetical protein [Polyangiaceae bacterium]MEB2322009.1 hypothetical protein [Sorangiineae bacterium]